MTLYTNQTAAPIEKWILNSGLVKRKRGVRKKAYEREIVNLVTAFDIETTTIHLPKTDNQKHNAHSFMYIWMWAFGRGNVIIGRTWEEYKNLLSRIEKCCESIKEDRCLEQKPLLIGYVHNLAYEFSFISDKCIYDFNAEECFFRKPRKPLYCRLYNAIEYRCSYAQSNMSLEKFAENMGCSTKKLDGSKFDYKKMRYPWTSLTDYEIEYCCNDVIALVEAIENEMEKDGDNLRTIPLTSTGYVRRDCKKALYPIRPKIRDMLPDIEQYKLLREAFRGGNTHANRHHAGHITLNVESYDMASCYPAQQTTEKFPMSAFKWIEKDDDLLKRAIGFISRGDAVVGRYGFKNIRLRDFNEPVPYITTAKAQVLYSIDDGNKKKRGRKKQTILRHKSTYKTYKKLTPWTRARTDNGRLLRAPYCIMALTEIDLEIVTDQYDFDSMSCLCAMRATKDYLPQQYRDVVLEYYRRKTELKGVEGREYEYVKSKNKLNSVYGMSAQDVMHQIIEYCPHLPEQYKVSDYTHDKATEMLRRANFPYQWGVYTTAYARRSLQEGINEAGSRLVYCDTDSNKTIGDVDYSAINKKRIKIAKANGAYAKDPSGVTHYMGVYEKEKPYERFITQGAKRYAYEQKDKKGGIKTGVTVSGVTHKKNRDSGIEYCVEELNGIENFKPGMIWSKAGGTCSIYNDFDDFDYIDLNTGRSIHIGKNVAIVDSTYELSYSKDYSEMLQSLELYREWRDRKS